MWTIEPREVLTLTGGGGEPFARFINAVIRAHCFALGLPDNQISTTVRTNYPDGGVDAAVHAAALNDRTGRFAIPTVWQYKATSLASISDNDLIQEVGKPYSRQLIDKGYGYRLCVCDDVPDQTRVTRAERLTAAVRVLSPHAPAVQLLGASDLAAWSSRFPSVAAGILGRPIGICRHWRAWATSEVRFTPEYVLPNGWDSHFSAIRDHIDFVNPADEPIVAIKGAAGVGKTRLVLEAIQSKPAATGLVIITEDDEPAVEVAHWLANQDSVSAILIADECSIEGSEKLRRYLRGSQARIRGVAIDNSGDPPHSGAPGIWLDKIDGPSVEKILERNYAGIPSHRRWAYADLSGGYVRIAADLCRHDVQLCASGNLDPAIPVLDEYYHCRLTDEERRAVETVSLLQRVGCDEDVKRELELLADLTGTDARHIRDTAQRLRASPGFLVRTPRYLYVTPKIIAEIAFTHAWERWGRPNPAAFLDRIPEQLLPAFESRVQQLMNQDVRTIVSAHFRDRVSRLAPTDLTNPEKVGQLLGLLETDPKTYLPTLHRLISDSSRDDLLAQGGDFGQTGTRRSIVWAAQRLAAFPELFDSAEYILRQLAIAESEPRIGNNATGIWCQLFRVWLSGTAVPFPHRYKMYRRVLFSGDPLERDLALKALRDIWSDMVSRMGSPSVVGGRFPPQDWAPSTREEFEACRASEFSLIEDMVRVGGEFADAAWSYLIARVRSMIARGELRSLQALTDKVPIPEHMIARLLEELDEALHYDCGGAVTQEGVVSTCYADVAAWRAQLAPKDFAGHLRCVVGKDIWHHNIRQDIWRENSELDPIAEEFMSFPGLLEQSLDYLCSPDARSAAALGSAIGSRDEQAKLLSLMLSTAKERRSTALLWGYIVGLVRVNPGQHEKVREVVDRLESDDPEVALVVIEAAVELVNPIVRIPRLVRAQKVGIHAMRLLEYGGTLEKASPEEFAAALSVFDRDGLEPGVLEMASELVGTRMHRRRKKGEAAETAEAQVRMLSILRRCATVEGGSSYWWGESLQVLADSLPVDVIDVAVLALTGKDYSKHKLAEKVLAGLAAVHPQELLQRIGPSVVDDKTGWKWRVASYKALFAAIPVEALMAWLDQVGLEGARGIARHLPSPYIEPSGDAVVPETTARVMAEYGDDERVASEFFAGRHHLQVYTGSLAENYEAQARRAEPFLGHRIPAIRRWADDEIASSRNWAERWRRESEDCEWQ